MATMYVGINICPAVGDNITQHVASGAQCRGMQKVYCWNVNETYRYPVDHDQLGNGLSYLKRLPSKFINHLIETASGFIVSTDKSGL